MKNMLTGNFGMKRYLMLMAVLLLLTVAAGAQAYPAYVYADYMLSEDSDPAVHALVKEGAQLVASEPRQARQRLVQALEKVSQGMAIDEYDYLWTQYGLMKATMEAGSADFGPGTQEEYVRVARHVLEFLDEQGNTGEWVYTELGAFRMEVYRTAANGLAWHMMESGSNLEKALVIIDKGIQRASRGEEDNYMLDTKVRILLKMGKKQEAWRIVAEVLDKDAEFGDFQDIRQDPEYRAWKNAN